MSEERPNIETRKRTFGRSEEATSIAFAIAIAGLALSPLWFGFEPVGGDPDRLYRPIKAELARSLMRGEPPLWSDRFGLGVPLAAESHVAAFYPLNLAFYRALPVSIAYDLLMWFHYTAICALTYIYARVIGSSPRGAALSAISFTFCGFMAIHSSHEPFYHAIVYLLFVLIATDRYAATGKIGWAAAIALGWGVQLTLGHYQIQMWTAGLASFTGWWRIVVERGPRSRAFGLIVALAWGAMIAAVPLLLSERFLVAVGMTRRSFHDLSYYAFPPENWVEAFIPELFRGLKGGPDNAAYWTARRSSGYEACLYIGTIPLIMAFVGLFRRDRPRGLAPWYYLIGASLLLSILPNVSPAIYRYLLMIPGIGFFRAPGRYTLIAMLGLALSAGSGFERSIGRDRFRVGLALAIFIAIVAFDRSVVLGKHGGLSAQYVAVGLGPITRLGLGARVAAAAFCWTIGLVVVTLWRKRKLSSLVPLAIASGELVILFYTSTTVWGPRVRIPEDSPVLSRLSRESDVGRIAGFLENVPIFAGFTPARPYLVQNLPQPQSWLSAANFAAANADPAAARLLRRYGVTHGVWSVPVKSKNVRVLYQGSDKALDQLITPDPREPFHRIWTLVRYPEAFPRVRPAIRVRRSSGDREILESFQWNDSIDEARLGPEAEEPPAVLARSARIFASDGMTTIVDTDGACLLVIDRTYDEGWRARIDRGENARVERVDGGIMGVWIKKSGRTTVTLRYRPAGLWFAAGISVFACLVAVVAIGFSIVQALLRKAESTKSAPLAAQSPAD